MQYETGDIIASVFVGQIVQGLSFLELLGRMRIIFYFTTGNIIVSNELISLLDKFEELV